MQVLMLLNAKFLNNLNTFLDENNYNAACKEIDLKARAIAVIGQIALKSERIEASQKELTSIFEEVFSDLILSAYFTACALDKPAQSVLRRALEVGVAIVYLWDLPHAYWAWKKHDHDLNFNEMLEHLSNDGYKSFLNSLIPEYAGDELLDYSGARRLYRILSNTIHGKLTTHESNLPDRFSYNSDDCQYNIGLIKKVQDTLLNLYRKRFPKYYSELSILMPSIDAIL